MVPHADIALLELSAELRGCFVELRSATCPLRKFGVACRIHPHEARHASILRLRCHLEPHAAAAVGEAPAVAQRIHEEQAAAAFFGRPPARQLLAANSRTGIANLTANPSPAGLERQLDRAAGSMAHGVRDEL